MGHIPRYAWRCLPKRGDPLQKADSPPTRESMRQRREWWWSAQRLRGVERRGEKQHCRRLMRDGELLRFAHLVRRHCLPGLIDCRPGRWRHVVLVVLGEDLGGAKNAIAAEDSLRDHA